MEGKEPNCIRITTDNGSVSDLEGPKLVQDVTSHFPGYGIFRPGRVSSPLLDHEHLYNGQCYYLLPLRKDSMGEVPAFAEELINGSALEVLPSQKNGVWRVKLLIDTKELEQILSEEVNTVAMIEKMRMAAKVTSG